MKKLLANLFIYRNNIKNTHWRMFGADFIDVHKFTDQMYSEIDEFIDRVVEKYIQLNEKVDTTMEAQIKNADIKELKIEELSVTEGIKNIVKDGKEILKQAESINDKKLGTMYLVIDDLKEYLEKTIWLLSKQIKNG